MTDEQKADFNRRIANANAMQLIDLLYDMLLLDLSDAEKTYHEEPEKQDEAKDCLRHAQTVLDHLQKALSFQEDREDVRALSGNLYSLYDYCKRRIARSIYMRSPEAIADVRRVIEPLAESFKHLAETDDAPPLMEHTQDIVAGYTYGPKDINETVSSYDSNRGFTV